MKFAAQLLAILAFGPGPVATALAESAYACHKGIVQLGETTHEVLTACGEPASREQVSGGGADLLIENWYYTSNQKLSYLFQMQGGRLARIERLGR